jgi:hypothetical protein
LTAARDIEAPEAGIALGHGAGRFAGPTRRGEDRGAEPGEMIVRSKTISEMVKNSGWIMIKNSSDKFTADLQFFIS